MAGIFFGKPHTLLSGDIVTSVADKGRISGNTMEFSGSSDNAVFGYRLNAFDNLGAAGMIAVVGTAVKLVIDRFDLAMEQTQGILAPDNLFLLYLGLALIKTLHEFGHAVVCKRFGGEVHIMGVMLLVFTPLPYMDATSSWAFRSRWKRAFVGAAGMITEIFVAGLATIVWAQTGTGAINSLAYNMMFIASEKLLSHLHRWPQADFQASDAVPRFTECPAGCGHATTREKFGENPSYGASISTGRCVYLR